MKKLVAASLLVAGLSGCAIKPVMLQMPATPPQPSFTFVDQRPVREAQREVLSYLVTSCNFGIWRLADDFTVPGKMQVLQSDLQELVGEQLKGRTVTVNSYALYQNRMRESRERARAHQPASLLGFAIAETMNNMGEDCMQSQTAGGWYGGYEVENTTYSPFVLELKLSVDDKPFAARVVKAPGSELGPTANPEWARLTRALFREAATSIARQVAPNSNLPGAPPPGLLPGTASSVLPGTARAASSGTAPSASPGSTPAGLPGTAPAALPGTAPAALPGTAPVALPGPQAPAAAADR